MSPLDTTRKFHKLFETATHEVQASLEVTPLRDGCFQVVAESATLKRGGKKWHTDTVIFALDADQVAKLREALA